LLAPGDSLGTVLAPSVVDRAGLGFPGIVNSRLFATSQSFRQDKFLSDHAKGIYANLLVGLTVDGAVRSVEDDAGLLPAEFTGTNFVSMGMYVKGDRYMRLISVYTGNNSSPTNPLLAAHPDYYPYRWYLINPSVNP
jgi:hypothetical protein